MSFYFQPPIFAVQPSTCVQPVVLAPPPAVVVPAAHYYYTAAPAVVTAYHATPPLIQVYTAAPMVSAAAASALTDSQRPGLHIRIIYYGHDEEPGPGPGPGRDGEARPGPGPGRGRRRLWCRATDARYAEVPTGPRLREDISRLAGLHNLAQARWRHARVVVAAAGSAGPVIAAGLGPVLGDDVVRVLELRRDVDVDVAAGDDEREEEAAEAERRRVLETSLAGGQRVFLTVCMDDDDAGAPPLLGASGRDG